MKIDFDRKADAFLIRFGDGRISRDVELAPNVFAGYDRGGKLLEIQILEASGLARPWFTLDAFAEALKKSRRTVERWIESGKVKARKVGREYQIPADQIKKVSGE